MADEQSTPQPPEPQPEPEPMTRERAIELLKTDVKAWNEWRQQKLLEECLQFGTKEELPDLSKATLWNARLEGADLRRVHLEGAKLFQANLKGADLCGAHFEEAMLVCAHLKGAQMGGGHFEGADLSDAHLEGACLPKTHLEGANLRNAHLEGTIMSDAHLEGAELRNAHLEGAMLRDAHLEGARLNYAHLEGADLRGADFSNADVSGVTYDRTRGKFRGIRVATCYGHALFARDARDQDYIETFRAQSWWHAVLWFFWAFFTDCGRSLLRVGLIGVSLAAFFGWVYEHNPALLDMKGSAQTPWTPYYYSIVTFTTLGFGDVTPATFEGELWVGAEVLSGYLMLGLLVSILANKVARRA